jgi:predicted membrane protein
MTVLAQIIGRMNLFKEKNEFEECILCHESTDVKKTTHVDLREYFVKGMGQSHEKCYQEALNIYGTNN